MPRVLSREQIARQAEAAVLWAAAHPEDPPPKNPYCEFLAPEHHAEWAASLKRAEHEEQAVEGCDGSA